MPRKPSSSKSRRKTPETQQPKRSEPVVALPGRTLEETAALRKYLSESKDATGRPLDVDLICYRLVTDYSETLLDGNTFQRLAPQGLTLTEFRLRFATCYTLCGILLQPVTVARIAGIDRHTVQKWYRNHAFCDWIEHVLMVAGVFPAWVKAYAAMASSSGPSAAFKYLERYGHLRYPTEQASPFEGMDIPDPSTAVDMAKAAKSKGGAAVANNDPEAETPGGGGGEGGTLYHISPPKNSGEKIGPVAPELRSCAGCLSWPGGEGQPDTGKRPCYKHRLVEDPCMSYRAKTFEACEEDPLRLLKVEPSGGIPVSKGDTVEFYRNGDIRVKAEAVSSVEKVS